MLNRLIGTVKEIKEQSIVLSCSSFWFELFVPRPSLWAPETQTEIPVYMHWNQETGPTLYGFSNEIEKQLFILVTSCSGVGPKLGLAILADIGVKDCIQAIQKQDEQALSKVSGIGPRKAEQILVQLRHKLPTFAPEVFAGEGTSGADWQLVAKTLESLSYSRAEVARALAHLRTAPATETMPFDQLVKQALSYLTR